jgi:hypothetical protein
MRQIIIKEIKKKAFLTLIVLYGIVIYFPILSSIYDILLSTALFMIAIYILLHTQMKGKIYSSSILFTLAFFTKVVVAIPMACVFAYYLYREHKTEYKAILKEGIQFSLTFFALTGGVFLLFPKIFYYILIAHSTIASGTYAGAVDMFFKGLNIITHQEWYASIIVYIIILSAIFFFIKKNIYFFISSFMFFIALMKTLHIINGETIRLHYYFTIYYLFFIIGMYILFSSTKSKKIMAAMGIISLLLIAPFVIHFYYEMQFTKIQKITSTAGIEILSNIDGEIFVENKPNRITIKKFFPQMKISNKEFTFLRPEYYDWDQRYSKTLEQLGIIEKPDKDYNKFKRTLTEDLVLKHAQELAKDKYNMVLVTTHGGDNIMAMYYYNLQAKEKKVCGVKIPYFVDGYGFTILQGRHKAAVFFKEDKECFAYAEAIKTYYTGHFEEICRISEDAANEVKEVLKSNGNHNMVLPECKKKGKLTFQTREKFKINWMN